MTSNCPNLDDGTCRDSCGKEYCAEQPEYRGPWMYRGSFPLDRLPDGQFVRSAGDGTGACEVGNDEVGWTRYAIGDFVPGRTPRSENES